MRDGKIIRCKCDFSDLNKLGVVERKSLILTFPTEQQVPKHLMPHFIRGYFDGDGSVYKQKQGNTKIEIGGTGFKMITDIVIK